jgi:hypothetical protein
MARRRVVIVGHFRPHVRVIETVLQKPLDSGQDLLHLPNMAVKGRTGRIIQLAKAAMEEGMDLDTAWKHATSKVPCAPCSLSLAYTIFLTLVTKPSTT